MDSSNSGEARNSIFTTEDIVNIAYKVKNNSSIKVLDYQLNNQSSYKLGMTGYHLHLEIKVQKRVDTNIEILNLFVKCIPFDNPAHAEIVKSQALYEKEIYFFDKIVPLLKSNFKIKKYLPECYLVKEGVIVLENLISQGYQIFHSFFDDYQLFESAFATLARFHSASLLIESRLNLESKSPMTLKERYSDAFEEKPFAQAGPMKMWFNNNVTLTSNIAKHYGKDSEKLPQQFNRAYEVIKPSKKHRNTICHSDIYVNNLMFDGIKPIPNCVLVDFQTIRYAPLVLDLLQLLYLNASRSFRIDYEKKLIKYYHSIMKDTIKCNDLLGNIVIPTEEEILFGLKDLRIYGSILACFYLPLTALDPKVISDLTNDGRSFDELLYSDRTKFTLDNMKKDKSYEMKILEAISEVKDN